MKKLTLTLMTHAFVLYSACSYATQHSADTTTTPQTPANLSKTSLPPNDPSMVPPAPEEESPLTGTFDLTSNYIFRGISQSNNLPAVQGGLTYTFLTTGIYFNVWGSNVSFEDIQGNTATVELDTIAGITNSVGEHFNYNLSLGRYNYPKAGAANYNEFIGVVSYDFLSATLGYSPNVYNTHETGTYYSLGINYEIPSEYIKLDAVSVLGSVGHYSLPSDEGYPSYNDWMIGIQKVIKQYTLSLQWTDTNGDANQGHLDDGHLVATVLVNF